MKKINFKNIIVALFSFALLFTAQSAFAATWNGDGKDCASMAIANYTKNIGYVNPCWPLSNVSADKGETVNVRIYYHNTSSKTATNVKLVLNAPSGTSSNQTFTGMIVSDQGNLSLGPVTANIPSGESLSFGSVRWYPDQRSSQSSFLYGQNGSEITNNGLRIGDITAGWGSQGSAVVSFKVSSSSTPNPTNDCRITDFRAVPSSIESDDYSKLIWETTSGCDYVTISGVSGVKDADGEYKVSPNSDTTYILKAYENEKLADTDSLTVKVDDDQDNNHDNNDCRIKDFNADDTSIEDGDSTVLEWEATSDCDYVTLTGVSGKLRIEDDRRVEPSSTKTYTLRAYDEDGDLADTDTVKITVDDDNNDDDDEDNNDYCTISNFTANGSTYNLSINQGDVLRLVWDTQGCSSVRVSGSDFSSSEKDDSRTVYPRASSNYTISAYSSRTGTITETIYVNVNPKNINVPQTNACTVTTVATNITSNGAQLNGLISNSTNQSVNTYFEYGTTTNLGSRTATRSISGNGLFSEYVSGLAPNTYYYFRGSSNCANGQLGNIEVFKTAGAAVIGNNGGTRTVIVQGTTVTGTESPIMLRIENKYQSIGVGDVVDYTVYYKNIGRAVLTNPVLQVVLPGGVVLTNSSRGTYSADSNTLSIPLENLAPGAEGVIYLQGKVNFLTTGYAQIVTTAILVYTNPNGAQENAIAYVLNNPKLGNNNLLGASAFFGGNFLGLGLIGWLLLLILILLIILASRSYRNKTTVTRTYSAPTGTTH